jgi:hypothetical protein
MSILKSKKQPVSSPETNAITRLYAEMDRVEAAKQRAHACVTQGFCEAWKEESMSSTVADFMNKFNTALRDRVRKGTFIMNEATYQKFQRGECDQVCLFHIHFMRGSKTKERDSTQELNVDGLLISNDGTPVFVLTINGNRFEDEFDALVKFVKLRNPDAVLSLAQRQFVKQHTAALLSIFLRDYATYCNTKLPDVFQFMPVSVIQDYLLALAK